VFVLKMKNHIAVIILFAVYQAGAITLLPAQKTLVDSSITLMICGSYGRAFSLLDTLDKLDKKDPLAPVLKIFARGLRDLDFERSVDSAGFEKAYQTAMNRLKTYETAHGISSYSLTLTGYAKAGYASYHGRQKRYGGAIQTGLNALDLMRQAQQLDSTETDADFFLGLYDFAKSDLKRRLWWVLFWYPADRERGIKRLERCSKGSGIAVKGAELALADVFLQTERMEKARRCLADLNEQFPQSRFVLWAQARFYELLKEYKQAADIYHQLFLSYKAEKLGNINALVTGYQQALMLHNAGDNRQAQALCAVLIRDCAAKSRETDAQCRDIQKLMEHMAKND
jgi:tetratricopeptide (TPR) repeat protein